MQPLRHARVELRRAAASTVDDYWRLNQRLRVLVARRGLTRPSRWRRSHGWLYWVVVGADLVLALTIVFDVWTSLRRCDGDRCGQPWATMHDLLGYVQPVLYLAAGVTIFWLIRKRTVVSRYRRRAITEPKALVHSAGSILDEVVGRSQLCQRIMEDLRERDRRVHVLQAGVGGGKTAVLVELTRQLALKGAVPVNVKLSGADKDLDFRELALTQFTKEVRGTTFTGSDAERIFRTLCRLNKLVVLADGLEDALTDAESGKDRDSVIRAAIRRAQDDRLPLIITSRPHAPLRSMDAVIIELEPLGEGPALDYAHEGAEARDHAKLTRMILHADVPESPLYLTLARRLYREAPELWRCLAGPDIEPGHGTSKSDAIDRRDLQLRMLDTWRYAMVEGYMYQAYALSRDLRKQAFDSLSALACVGLLGSTTPDVQFEKLFESEEQPAAPQSRDGDRKPSQSQHQLTLIRKLGETYHKTIPAAAHSKPEVREFLLEQLRIAATMGEQLGIVDAAHDGVRFRHSLVKAYLGSRWLPEVMDCAAFGDRMRAPVKEFLIALILASRARPDNKLRGGPDQDRPESHPSVALRSIPDRLADAAKDLIEWKPTDALDCYAAAFEISAKDVEPETPVSPTDGVADMEQIAAIIADQWNRFRTDQVLDRAMVDARRDLVVRMGEAARRAQARVDGRHTESPARSVETDLLSYVDVTGTRYARYIEASATLVEVGSTTIPIYGSFYKIAVSDDDYPTRLAITQQIGDGGDAAFRQLAQEFDTRWEQDHQADGRAATRSSTAVEALTPDTAEALREAEDHEWRQRTVCAWLAPLLYLSSTNTEPGARRNLRRWVDDLASADPNHPDKQPDISAEIALAQGFRLAANKRIDETSHGAQAIAGLRRKRAELLEWAESALAHSHFWFSQLALIHALALLSLPDDPTTALPGRGHGSDPHADMRYWTLLAGSRVRGGTRRPGHPHPLVKAAADLAALAVTSRRPEQFLWIDEDGVCRQVGSSSGPATPPTDRPEWILPSAGWTTLHPKAQALVADVLLMLNLADRGDTPSQREERLRRADRDDLPPCMTRAREQLGATLTAASIQVGPPGTACIDDCPFRLCPYPPIGDKSYHSEVSEGLCRKLAAEPPRFAPWQKHLTRRDLKKFWTDMARRSQPLYGGAGHDD